jgi:hypothetical protein
LPDLLQKLVSVPHQERGGWHQRFWLTLHHHGEVE